MKRFVNSDIGKATVVEKSVMHGTPAGMCPALPHV
jgi:hypothetical protein